MLLTAAKGIAEIITVSAYVNIDFRDVNTVMENSGTALMGAGEGHGENRARQAIEEATTSVLLNDNDIRGAQNILLYFSCSPDHQITMDELGEVTDYLTDLTGNNGANVIWGIGDDDNLNDELRITLIATGFEPLPGPVIHQLPTESITPDPEPKNDEPKERDIVDSSNDSVKEQLQDVHEAPVDESGIHMVHKAQTTVETVVAAAIPEQPVVTDNPFDAVEVSKIDGKRHLTLEMPATEEIVETATAPVAETVEVVKEEHNYFDDIRVIKRTVEQPVAKEPVVAEATVEQAQQSIRQEPVFRIEQTPVVEQPRQEVAQQPQAPSFADQQLARAFTPQTDEQKIMARAERIRKMNELLRNDPDGPRKIEEMTTEQLSSEPIYHTSHSSESDAVRTTIGASGIMSSGMSFLDNLPD